MHHKEGCGQGAQVCAHDSGAGRGRARWPIAGPGLLLRAAPRHSFTRGARARRRPPSDGIASGDFVRRETVGQHDLKNSVPILEPAVETAPFGTRDRLTRNSKLPLEVERARHKRRRPELGTGMLTPRNHNSPNSLPLQLLERFGVCDRLLSSGASQPQLGCHMPSERPHKVL